MGYINHLPSELLLDIFERLANTSSTGTLTAALSCCRTWRRLASSVLYAHIALDSKLNPNCTLALFTNQRPNLHLVQSLTLRMHSTHLMGFSIKLPRAYDRLDGLTAILPTMTNLRTFSLTLEEQLERDYNLPTDAVSNLLKHLPESVVNLELDSNGLDDIQLSGLHLCEAVGTLIPRLHCLRLRLSHLCPSLLAPLKLKTFPELSPKGYINPKPASTLRTAVIRLDKKISERYGPIACICGTPSQMKHRPRLLFPPHFASTIRQLYQSGALPHLQRWILIDRVEADRMEHEEQWSVFKVRDVTANTTTTFPWCARGGSSHLHMLRDVDGADLFWGFADMAKALEGEVAWDDLASRARIPPPLPTRTAAEVANTEGWHVHTCGAIGRTQAKNRHGVDFPLWKREDIIGKPILRARVAAGFNDVDAACEVLPQGWVWFRPPRNMRVWSVQRG